MVKHSPVLRQQFAEVQRLTRDALWWTYQKTLPKDVLQESFPAVSFKTVDALLKTLPSGLQDVKGVSLALSRACDRACGTTGRQPYTDQEQRMAVYEFRRSVDNKSHREIQETYGIGKTVLKRLRQQLEHLAGPKPTDKKLWACAEAMEIRHSGAQPYLNDVENALHWVKHAQRGDMGEGSSRQLLRADAKRMLHHIGEAEQDPAKRTRLLNAECSKGWAKDAQARAAPYHSGQKMRKPSGMSLKRAAAASPTLNNCMFDKIEDAYAHLRKEGILKTDEPEPEQVQP